MKRITDEFLGFLVFLRDGFKLLVDSLIVILGAGFVVWVITELLSIVQ